MKKINKILLSTLFLLTGCNNVNDIETIKIFSHLGKIEEQETFNNKFDETKIPGQWSEYGVGDPFVYRFNGRYYLYCSTKNFETGVRGWVSDDLINWEQLTGEGLETGYVSNDACTTTAYAPEVIYYDGYFYMLQSQGGNGHYLLKADKPEGPFIKVKDNFGESIDGSFFLDDDEQLYMLRASNTGIRLIKFNDDLSIGVSKNLDNTQLGGWTEGPYLLKRDGIYYLTYTGNNVISEGYRVGYSYATGELFDRSAFTEGDTILLSTDTDFKGLGHSSTVLGPDLDSYYIAYHNLNSSGGPDRSFNISRLSFSGTEMCVDYASLHNNYKPKKATFIAQDETSLTKENNFILSNIETSNIFTSEYNFTGDNTKFIFSYQNNDNYAYVEINNKTLNFSKVENGQTNLITSESLKKNYDLNKLHTIRIAYKDNKTSIYFDNMNKITTLDTSLAKGKIGYIKSNNTNIYYTAFSNVAFGTSSNDEVFQQKVLANNYYYSSFSKISGLIEEKINDDDEYGDYFNGKLNSYDLKLSKKDYAIYRMSVSEDGIYGLDFILDQKYANKKLIIQVDENKPIRMTIPSSNDASFQYVKSYIGDINLSKGSHYITIIGDDEIAFHSFEIFKSSASWPKFENDLSSYVSKGAKYINSWKLLDNGHYALAGNRNLMYFGDGTFTDFTLEVDIKLVGETQANTCGVILRANNPAFASNDTMASIQGYYCGFNNSKTFISKCDYNHSDIDISADALKINSDEYHHLKVVIRNNHISLDLDNGKSKLEYSDSIGFSHGNIGLYTDGAAAIYKNIKIYH